MRILKSVSLIFPAFNERARIQETVLEASSFFCSKGIEHEIIVCADGTDGTREHAQALQGVVKNLIVIGGSERRGKGYAIRKGVEIASCDIVGYADADNKTPITEFEKFIEHFHTGSQIVIGIRNFGLSETVGSRKWIRRVGSFVFNRVVKALLDLNDITELQCGFKFFDTRIAKSVFALQRINGYMFDAEILSIARKSKVSIQQVSVTWKDDRDSRLKLFTGNLRNFLDIVKICLRHYPAISVNDSAAQTLVPNMN